jgi:hypothetical protein
MGEWLVPFEGRNDSGACRINFLWRKGTLYIMDNHRAAAWCWLQHLAADAGATIVHIDAHYDTVGAGEPSTANQPPTASLSLREYLEAEVIYAGEPICVYRWDNYISLLQYHHRNFGKQWYFVTHDNGLEPDFEYSNVAASDVVGLFNGLLSTGEKFVLNLDLDYFRSRDGDRVSTENRAEMLAALATLKRNGQVLVFTLCLSPECCGDWSSAEELLAETMDAIDIKFALPPVA